MKFYFTKDFLDLDDQESIPGELSFFTQIGLDKFLVIAEVKSWWDWRAFAVAMIGLAQIIGGTVLVCFGVPNLGLSLIAEGINDMVYATMAGLNGTFSWRDWAIQKAISLCISLLSFGVAKLAGLATVATTVGSVSKAAVFAKCIGNAVLQFATTCLTNYVSNKIMEHVASELIKMIVEYIEKNLLAGLKEKIESRVKTLYETSKSDEEFENAYARIRENFEKALYQNAAIDKNVDQIRFVCSLFKKRIKFFF